MKRIRCQVNIGMIAGFAVLLFTTTLSSAVQSAVQLNELYDIEIPVNNQGLAERDRAMQQALSDMIMRLAGSRAYQQLARSSQLMRRAPSYVEQYRYRELQDADKPMLMLWLRFNPAAMQNLLQQEQLPVWGSTRPEILLWIAVEDNQGRSVINNDKRNSFQRVIEQHARHRGLPVILPIMDVEDRRKVRIGDIWGGFTTSIKVASARYDADTVVTARVYKDIDGWRAQWHLLGRSSQQSWSSTGRYPQQAIESGLDELLDRMVAAYAISGNGTTSSYLLSIAQVHSLQDYQRSRQYLERISVISRFLLHSLNDNRVVYRVYLQGDVDDLERALALESALQRDLTPPAELDIATVTTTPSQPPLPTADATTLYYRLAQ